MGTNKTIVLTGASSGLGRAAAHQLAASGWTVAVVGRNAQRTEDVATQVGGQPFVADFDRFDDVRRLAAELLDRFPRIDVLANNAGGLVSSRSETVDGHERTFQGNHLAPFLLTNLLLDRLVFSGGRVINTASVGNRWGTVDLTDLDSRRRPYRGGLNAYSTSKLETILFTKELARRSPITTWAFHPGSVRTAFGTDSSFGRFVMRLATVTQISPEAGAAPLIHLASADVAEAPSGTYFSRFTPNGATAAQANDVALAAGLWEASALFVGL